MGPIPTWAWPAKSSTAFARRRGAARVSAGIPESSQPAAAARAPGAARTWAPGEGLPNWGLGGRVPQAAGCSKPGLSRAPRAAGGPSAPPPLPGPWDLAGQRLRVFADWINEMDSGTTTPHGPEMALATFLLGTFPPPSAWDDLIFTGRRRVRNPAPCLLKINNTIIILNKAKVKIKTLCS